MLDDEGWLVQSRLTMCSQRIASACMLQADLPFSSQRRFRKTQDCPREQPTNMSHVVSLGVTFTRTKSSSSPATSRWRSRHERSPLKVLAANLSKSVGAAWQDTGDGRADVLRLQSIKHIDMDLRVVKPKAESRDTKVKLVVWHGGRKHVACLRTVRSLIENMITGVTKGFRYKVRLVYAHFPINLIIQENGSAAEIRNFLGEKVGLRRTRGLELYADSFIVTACAPCEDAGRHDDRGGTRAKG